MINEQQSIDNLFEAYRLYCIASKDKNLEVDPDEYAFKCTENYVTYVRSCQKDYPNWTLSDMVKNEIRILMGLAECYKKRDFKVKPKTSNKTRWSL
jgi:hypothetical protein